MDAVPLNDLEALLDSKLGQLEERVAETVARATHHPPESLLTVQDMAALLQCDARSIHRWWRAGDIPKPLRIGGVLRWYGESVRQWLQEAQDAGTRTR